MACNFRWEHPEITTSKFPNGSFSTEIYTYIWRIVHKLSYHSLIHLLTHIAQHLINIGEEGGDMREIKIKYVCSFTLRSRAFFSSFSLFSVEDCYCFHILSDWFWYYNFLSWSPRRLYYQLDEPATLDLPSWDGILL